MVRRYFGGYGSTHYGYFAKRPLPLAPAVAALRVQAAARGFLARRTVRAVRAVDLEAERVRALLQEAARGGEAAGVKSAAVTEELMRLLLRLDAVRGAHAYRRRVVARVLELQGDGNGDGAAAE